MDFPVRKGLEAPLKVHGMYTRYFCIYCVVVGVMALVAVSFLTSAMSGKGSFLFFIVALLIVAGISVAIRVVFINLSTEKKYTRFRKKVFVISNKDLLHSLK